MKSTILSLHFLPAYMKVVILLRSNGGAHFDSIAAIDGYVTAYSYTESNKYESKTLINEAANELD